MNANSYNPNQHTQTYVVAQGRCILISILIVSFVFLGSASSGNPSLFPQNLTNYYTNVFNPNVNTQFLQNANPPNTNWVPTLQQQQQQFVGPMSSGGIGIPVSSVE